VWWWENCFTAQFPYLAKCKQSGLRNFEGFITTYPEPENYVPGRSEDYFKNVYPAMENKRSITGISGLMNDKQFNLVPEGLSRINRRFDYEKNPIHSTIKDKREKRDEIKEKKFQAQHEIPTATVAATSVEIQLTDKEKVTMLVPGRHQKVSSTVLRSKW
jgi:hypothetical protein